MAIVACILPGTVNKERHVRAHMTGMPLHTVGEEVAVPGFFAGVLFSAVLGVAGRRRRLDELTLPQVALWGAAGGLLLTLLPFALVAVGLASREGSQVGTWQILAVTTAPFLILSAASASVTLSVARKALRWEARTSADAAAFAAGADGQRPAIPGAGIESLHESGAARTRQRAGVGASAPRDGP